MLGDFQRNVLRICWVWSLAGMLAGAGCGRTTSSGGVAKDADASSHGGAPGDAGVFDGRTWKDASTDPGEEHARDALVGDDSDLTVVAPTDGNPLTASGSSSDAGAVGDAGARDAMSSDGGPRATTVPGGATWVVPQLSGNALTGVWGSGRDDVWVVGSHGVILHWNGSLWASVDSGTTQGLAGVWGAGPSDVWAVGDAGTVVHWNGSAWATVPSGTTVHLDKIWGTGAKDIWAVGGDLSGPGIIEHWDGSAWSKV